MLPDLTAKMLDVLFYRDTVLEIILQGQHVSKHVAELRLSLFIIATLVAETKPECLKPFPPCFYDNMTKTQNYSALLGHIGRIPDFKEFQVRN